MSEVFFYHLQPRPLERVLPVLLEKCLERGWNVVVQAGSSERVEAIDQLLPHGGLRTDAITEWVAEAEGCGAATLSLIACK